MVTSPLSDKYDTWERELCNDPDRDFILRGLREGFLLVDSEDISHVDNAQTANHSSATSLGSVTEVEELILSEIYQGHYIPVYGLPPRIISGLAAVPKADGSLRLIHDLSKPAGKAVNDYATKETFTCDTVNTAIDLINRNWFMAKIDLQSAYRSVPIHPNHQTLTGLQWTFLTANQTINFVDSRLPFGARKSPAVFHRITQAVKRMMIRRGYDATVVYLDDFFIAGRTFCECLNAYNALLVLLRSLGFSINWRKICDPSQRMTFLGIVLDTVNNNMSLKPEKVHNYVMNCCYSKIVGVHLSVNLNRWLAACPGRPT